MILPASTDELLDMDEADAVAVLMSDGYERDVAVYLLETLRGEHPDDPPLL